MQTNQIPQNWDFFICRIDGNPASIRVNLGLNNVAPVEGFSQLFRFMVRMQKPTEDGLSSNEEYPILCDIEDAIFDAINPQTTIPAGVVKSEGILEFWIYAQSVDGLGELIASVIDRQFDGYQYAFESFEEPEWETYFDFLYPDAFSMQTIMNRRVFMQLQEQGDNEQIAREIDHWLYFPTQEGMDAFREIAKSLGYNILSEEKLQDRPDDSHPYQVHISREDVPSPPEMDDLVWELMDKIYPLDGYYDGWGCNIVKY